MSLTLYSIIRGLVKEDVGNGLIDKINKAIDERRYVSLYYNDRKGDETGLFPRRRGNPRAFRRVVPYCLFERNGKLYLRGYHSYPTNTKRGPFRWKLFKVENISNLRIYANDFPKFTEKSIPNNYNPDGDKMATRVLNIADFSNFVSPLDREKQVTNDVMTNTKRLPSNKAGYMYDKEIRADQKRKVTVDTYAKQHPNWAMYKKNVEDTANETDRNTKFSDYEKAERELNQQRGPILQNGEEQEGYNEYTQNNKNI